MSEEKAPVVKKGRGRPRKVPETPTEKIDGIVYNCTNDNLLIEFVHFKADILKLIVETMQTMKCVYLIMSFREAGIRIYSHDSDIKYRFVAEYKCKHVGSYYCAKEMDIALTVLDLASICKKIDKETNKFCIEIERLTYKQYIKIILHYRVQETYDVNTINIVDNNIIKADNFPTFESIDYPLKFEVDYGFFKKQLANAKAMNNVMEIKYESGVQKLQYITKSNTNQVVSNIFPKKDKIKLDAEAVEGYFSIHISTSYANQVFKKKICETVKVNCSQTKDIVFSSLPEPALTVRISIPLHKNDKSIVDDSDGDDADEKEDSESEESDSDNDEKKRTTKTKKK
jgi:hypothetical protein